MEARGYASVIRFKPAWWCRGPHLQTLWPVLFRRRARPAMRRERLELPDGDFLDLDWTGDGHGPIVILLHGLEGNSRSHYARGMLQALPGAGMRAVLMHFRGCSGEPNRLARAYHSGDTGDLDFVAATLRQREPQTPLMAVGYSLGGNVLLKWLGERGAQAGLRCAVAVSVPLLLHESTAHMNRGFSRFYQWWLVRHLKRSYVRKNRRHPGQLPLREVRRLRSFYDFDDRITAPLHGYTGAMHYYNVASSRQYLAGIRIPTLMLQAADDPFMPESVIPPVEELSPSIQLEVHRHGGHVGFVAGNLPWRPRYWLEQRIPGWLRQQLAGAARTGHA
jgi:predicted alpha/beta-fold hydrolase